MAFQAEQNFERIKREVRRLTASPSAASLPEQTLEDTIQTFVTVDLLPQIKTDISRSVYKFYTTPNVDRYPLDVNQFQAIREAAYVEGIRATLYKDRGALYRVYPRWPDQKQPVTGDGEETEFSFDTKKNIVPLTVTMGSVDVDDTPIKIVDDGGRGTTTGSLILVETDASGNIVPELPETSPIPDSMPSNAIGTINYVSGSVSLTLPKAIKEGESLNVWVSTSIPGRPRSILFWKNEFIVRPVPNHVYRIEVEAYQTPKQFLNDSSLPELAAWSEYIIVGSAVKLLRDRQDMEGVQNLLPFLEKQEANLLERQAAAEIGMRNNTIYTDQTESYYNGYPYGVF